MLVTLINDDPSTLDQINLENSNTPLNPAARIDKSKILGSVPDDVLQYVASSKSCYYSQPHGVFNSSWWTWGKLSNFFQIDSLAQDLDGKWFVNLIEGKQYPFYGS